MKASFKVCNPDDMQMTLTCTMSLKEWKLIRDQLSTDWPAWQFSGQITSMINHATQHFIPDSKSGVEVREVE